MDLARRRRLLACLPGLLALGAAPHAAAERRPLRAAVMQIEPYGVIDSQGRVSGAFTEVFEMLGRNLGRPTEVVVAPYARTLALLRSGRVDMLLAMPSPAISEVAVPAGAVWSLETIAIGRAGTDLHRISDLHGLTVARIRGTDYGPELMDDKAIRHYEVTDHVQGFQMLMEKRIDAIVGGRPGVLYAMRKLGIRRNQLGASFVVNVREVQLHLSRRLVDEQFAAELRRGMAALRAEGRIEAVIAKYSAGLPRD
ncbi:substrate-binding periplasmic protein [Pseudoduganella sp. OTU4001]|uniref:substrate-binding periplasmic protein n=1 Tax=Pseudoduganella sp. OTU4001 TaxID=3043854 RepID=UPI00313ECCEE